MANDNFDNVLAGQLLGYVARLVKLHLEIDERQAEIKRLYAEARACKFNSVALKRSVKRRVLQEKAKLSYKKVGRELNPDGNSAEALYEAILNSKRPK